MDISNRKQNARGRIAVIEAHTQALAADMALRKNKVVMRGGLSVALGALSVGLFKVGIDTLAAMSAGGATGAFTTAVVRHVALVRPLDRRISNHMHDAEAIADEAGIPFVTNYVHPEARPIGRLVSKLMGRAPTEQPAQSPAQDM